MFNAGGAKLQNLQADKKQHLQTMSTTYINVFLLQGHSKNLKVDSLKFQHPNYLAPSRALLAIYFNVGQASQFFGIKIPYFSTA